MALRQTHMGVFGAIAFTIAATLLVPKSADAVNRRFQRYELQLGVGLDNFMGDICSPRNADLPAWVIPQTIGVVGNVGMKYNLSRRDECRCLLSSTQSIGASLFFGQLRAEEVEKNIDKFYYRNGIGFNTFFVELSMRYEWYFIKDKKRHFKYKKVGRPIIKRATIAPSYLFVGAGGLLNTGKFFWDNKDGHQSDRFTNIAPVLMGGIGTKLRINRGVSFGLEFGMRMALDDNIDTCDGNVETTPTKPWIFGKWIDQYQFITANVTFKIREKKNGWPDFRSIGK